MGDPVLAVRTRGLARSRIFVCLLLLTGCARAPDAASAYRAGHYTDAHALLLVQAEHGDVPAQNALGVLYYTGVGAPRDYSQALHWFERAALAGDTNARRHLGSMFRQGLGTTKDDFRAFGWYDAARQAGNPQAISYMQWMTLVVSPNQQALGRRIVDKDLKAGRVSHATPANGLNKEE